MTRKIKKHRLFYPHFRAKVDVLFSHTLTVAEISDYLSEIYPDLDLEDESLPVENPAALTMGPTNTTPIVIMINSKTTISDIHHEVIHITMFMFTGIGETHTSANDEFFAYTSTAIFEDIVHLIETKFKSKIPPVIK